MPDICNNMVEIALGLQSMDLKLLKVEKKVHSQKMEANTRELELEHLARCSIAVNCILAHPNKSLLR